ncbi:MAG TPA: hypothetical protein VGI46_14105 [Candidatus Acidoferrum sp.]|jgi:hypothetical protein
MAKANDQRAESILREQRADYVPTAAELRKGVNVLNTSDPKNPAPNPFVLQQQATQNPGAGTTQSKGTDNGSKTEKK